MDLLDRDTPMAENLERREYVRIDHTSPLHIEDLKSGKTCKARLFNYSKNGMYFESDSVMHLGDQINIGIYDSPYALESGILEYYRGEIQWRKKLEDSHFDYGYGVRFSPVCEDRGKTAHNLNTTEEIIKNQTKASRKSIKFTDKIRTYEGIIKDISPSGVFFLSQDTFEEGQILSFDVPLKSGKEVKIDGQIVWVDDDGIGVIFLNKN